MDKSAFVIELLNKIKNIFRKYQELCTVVIGNEDILPPQLPGNVEEQFDKLYILLSLFDDRNLVTFQECSIETLNLFRETIDKILSIQTILFRNIGMIIENV